jgi:DNA modification methylase
MEVFQQDISKLKPYEFNNRSHPEEQVERIAHSIKEFGFNQPLVVDVQDNIIVGHGRFLAAKKLGLSHVPCLMIDELTDEQIRAYRIIDNKLQNDSSWLLNNLELELGWLEDNDFDLEKYGLDDLQDLFPEDEPEVEEDDFEAQEDESEPYIKLGDMIELGRHRVLCGDSCTDWFEDIEPVLMVTDPPYGVEYSADWRDELLNESNRSIGKVSNDERVDWTEVYKAVNAQVAYVWHDGRNAAELSKNLQDSGYELVSQIIWAKPMFAISRGDYHWQHEPCWYAVKKGKNHNWQGSRSESTLWKIERGCKDKTGHSTEKPLECMAKPIKNNTKQGDIVADPFLGSGTTLIACEQLNRTCYGIELEPKYCQVIIERYKKHCEDKKKPFECKINGEAFDGA